VWQVSESQRASGILTMMEVEKSVVQGSGVGAIAALLGSTALQKRFAGKAVAAVCTGGNIEVQYSALWQTTSRSIVPLNSLKCHA
jgi:threonine dehydratase